MPAQLNLVGQRFTRLLVLEKRGKTQSGQYRYLCRCDCGVEKVVATGELRYGKTKSCGCYSKDKHEQDCISTEGQTKKTKIIMNIIEKFI